jgi:hypothetical protein
LETIAALFRRDGEPVVAPALSWHGQRVEAGPAWPALAHRLGLNPGRVPGLASERIPADRNAADRNAADRNAADRNAAEGHA